MFPTRRLARLTRFLLRSICMELQHQWVTDLREWGLSSPLKSWKRQEVLGWLSFPLSIQTFLPFKTQLESCSLQEAWPPSSLPLGMSVPLLKLVQLYCHCLQFWGTVPLTCHILRAVFQLHCEPRRNGSVFMAQGVSHTRWLWGAYNVRGDYLVSPLGHKNPTHTLTHARSHKKEKISHDPSTHR